MERVRIGRFNDLKQGEMKMVRAGIKEILVVRLEDKVYAIDGWCSHMRAPLDRGTIIDRTIRCRMHGAVFDLETGKVLMNPQAKDMRIYPVVMEGEDVYFEFET